MINNEYFESLKGVGIDLSEEQRQHIVDRISEKLNYHASIGVFGKTGVGKSSLCNSLFGQDVCPVSDVESCTREPKRVLLDMSRNNLTLVDVPGVGETGERDKEYAELYNNLMPELDLILWVLKGDDKAFVIDLQFYEKMIKKYLEQGKPILFVLNQVEKIMPFKEWNDSTHCPGPKQLENINAKIRYVADVFDIAKSNIVAVSAYEKYNLDDLLREIVYRLPSEKAIAVANELDPSFKDVMADDINDIVEDIVEDVIVEEMPEESQSKALQIVERLTCYGIEGFPSAGICSAAELASQYQSDSSYENIEDAIDAMIRWETSKNAVMGFVTNVGGLVTLPITLPADMAASWVCQARLSAAIAYMYGHDINEDRVKTFIIAAICGDSIKNLVKETAVHAANGLGKALIKKIPAAALRAINKRIGVQLITKAGQKSITSLVKMIPVFGGLVGGAFDAGYCYAVGRRAKSVFSNIKF